VSSENNENKPIVFVSTPDFFLPFEKLGLTFFTTDQGDQIGQIFAHWAITLDSLLKIQN
jgi:hypothetical protein